jgi:hypothetical protein
LNGESQELSFNTINGVKDEYEPFKLVSIRDEKMIWKRTEEDMPITVELERTDELPATYGDKLMGLWSEDINGSDYLYFGWDRRFELWSDGLSTRGVYHAHGHRSEVRIIPDNPQYEGSRWEVAFQENGITLTQLDTDSAVVREFVRIHQLPE